MPQSPEPDEKLKTLEYVAADAEHDPELATVVERLNEVMTATANEQWSRVVRGEDRTCAQFAEEIKQAAEKFLQAKGVPRQVDFSIIHDSITFNIHKGTHGSTPPGGEHAHSADAGTSP